jgi:hypothetical protein
MHTWPRARGGGAGVRGLGRVSVWQTDSATRPDPTLLFIRTTPCSQGVGDNSGQPHNPSWPAIGRGTSSGQWGYHTRTEGGGGDRTRDG